MRISFLFLLFFTSLVIEAQEAVRCERNVVYGVIAPSGLRMRSKPNTKSDIVVTVPYDSLVIACTETFGAFSTSETKGYWRSVQYHEHEGYMYDGFLIPRNSKRIMSSDIQASSEQKNSISNKDEVAIATPPPPTNFSLAIETYNYCGNIEEFNPGINWYGIYPPDENSSQYRMEKVAVELVLSQQRLSKSMEFDIRTDRYEKSVFLIGSEQALDRGTVLFLTKELQEALPLSLFPGQNATVFARSAVESSENIRLEALGAVTSGGDCPVLTNFKLLASTQLGQEKVEQDIAPLICIENACGVPELLWFGDINGDGYADALWASRSETEAQFSLMLSLLEEDNIWKLADTWSIKSCP
jgi:hypothetical protein